MFGLRPRHRGQTQICTILTPLTSIAAQSPSRRWAAAFTSESPAFIINIPLISVLTRATDYPDRRFASGLSNGMPIVGEVPFASALRKRIRATATRIGNWRDELPALNRANVERAQHAQNTEMAKIAWGCTPQEAQRGWVSGPTPIDDAVVDTISLTPRFARSEEHGATCAKNTTNRRFECCRRQQHPVRDGHSRPANTRHVPGHVCVYYSVISPSRTLLTCHMDFAHAYKHIGIANRHCDFATIIASPPGGPTHYAKLRPQPFRSSRGPENWTALPTFSRMSCYGC